MSRVIVIEFVSVDGIMEDPDGSDGSAQGGWAFRYGPEAVAGDKFGLKEVLDTVVSRSLERATDWQNSTVLEGDVVAAVRERKQARDIMVTGSTRVVRTLMAHDLVDEYRLIVFPIVLGAGTRLFPDGTPIDLNLVSVQTAGPAVRLTDTRP